MCVSFVLMAAVLAVGACGGGSGDPKSRQTLSLGHAGLAGALHFGASGASGAAGLPQSPFIARADAICRGLDSRLAAVKPASLRVPEIARFAPPRAALEKTAVTELSRLTPPRSIARDWRLMITYRRTLAEELAKLGQNAKVGDARGIQALAVSKKRVHQKLFTVATREGFKYCLRTE
jgi:hypothetical protein